MHAVHRLHRYLTVTPVAPTWTPQTVQQNWSVPLGRGNFIKAWGGSSPCGSRRVMPKLNGSRHKAAGPGRAARFLAPGPGSRNVDSSCRTEHGPSRRDPQGTSPNERDEHVRINTVRSSQPRDEGFALQGASATGGSAVTRRVRTARATAERLPSGVMPRSTSFEFGVGVPARMAHVNRAYVASNFVDGAYAHNQRRDHQARRCTLQNGLPAKSSAAHGVHG